MVLLKIKKKKLLNILYIINLIVEKKLIDKKSENILLIKNKKYIYFIGTDNIIKIKIKIKIKNFSKKKLLISFPIKNFTKIIKSLTDCIIKIIYKKKKIIIKKKNINYKFKTIKINYYNETKCKKNKKIVIKNNSLFNLIDSANFIINKNINKKTLLSIKENFIEIMSTDNYRLIYDKTTIENKSDKNINIILSNKTLNTLYKIIKLKNKKNIYIKYNKFEIIFKLKNLKIISKIIDDNYPTINNNFFYENNFIVNKNELKLSLKRSIIINEKENNFSKWIIENNILKILTKWNSNKGKEMLKINYQGKKVSIGINNNHIFELISNIKAKNLNFNFSNKNKNIIILNPEKKDFKYITTSIKI